LQGARAHSRKTPGKERGKFQDFWTNGKKGGKGFVMEEVRKGPGSKKKSLGRGTKPAKKGDWRKKGMRVPAPWTERSEKQKERDPREGKRGQNEGTRGGRYQNLRWGKRGNVRERRNRLALFLEKKKN